MSSIYSSNYRMCASELFGDLEELLLMVNGAYLNDCMEFAL